MICTNYDQFHKNTNVQYRPIRTSNFTYRLIIDTLTQYLPNKKLKILDIGSGAGTISIYLGRLGHSVLGIDVSSKAVGIALESSKNVKLDNISFKVLDFPNHQPKEKFDVVVCFEVLEHIPDDKKALVEIYKMLNSNGIIILSTPSKNAPLHRLGYAKIFDKSVGHLRRYTSEELVKMFSKIGFSEIKTKKTEGIIRNFLFLNPIAGKTLRFVKYFISDFVTYVDDITVKLFGESDIFVIAYKK